MRIMILAGPGHFRNSLEALLRTLPQTELVISSVQAVEPGGALASARQSRPCFALDALDKDSPDLVLLDLDDLSEACLPRLAALRNRMPGINWLALSNNPRHPGAVQRLEMDCVLAKSTPAGEFLPAVQQLGRCERRVRPPVRQVGVASHAFILALIHR